MICVQCDSSVSDDSRFCPQCGQSTPLISEASIATEAALTEAETAAEPTMALATVHATSHIATPVANSPAAPSPISNPIDTQTGQIRLSQANLCRMRRDWSAAVDHCVAVLQEQPANATAHSLLSDIYRDQGKLDDAIQWARLAIELKPSPADVAKLQKLEAERTHLMRQGDSRLLGSGLSRSMALAADGGIPNGTQNLMGIPPRKWLNRITTAAMVFVGAVLVVLAGLRYSRHSAPRPTFQSYASASNSYNGSGLPPTSLPVRSSGFVSASPSFNSGLPPDLRASSSAPFRKPAPASANLPLAPVLAARPIPTAVTPTPQRLSGGAAMSASAGTGAAQSGDATALPDGMWIASVQFPESGNARVKIGFRSANADVSAETRAAIVRNVYRAAGRLFEKYNAVQQVSVAVANDPADALIFSADVVRATALAMNADTAAASDLENSLQSARWNTPQPTQSANGSPSDDIPGVAP